MAGSVCFLQRCRLHVANPISEEFQPHRRIITFEFRIIFLCSGGSADFGAVDVQPRIVRMCADAGGGCPCAVARKKQTQKSQPC